LQNQLCLCSKISLKVHVCDVKKERTNLKGSTSSEGSALTKILSRPEVEPKMSIPNSAGLN
jgi:hypothetical protein